MNVLAVGCHPDDLEIGCGGTLAKYAAQGSDVTMCHVANWNMGHVEIPPDDLRRIRGAEAEASGRALGAKEFVGLDVPDLQVDSKDERTVRKLVEIIRLVRPDVILTHNPDDYMRKRVRQRRCAAGRQER
jgi:LmbE family N-acetylglucosaminyl deacetylase